VQRTDARNFDGEVRPTAGLWLRGSATISRENAANFHSDPSKGRPHWKDTRLNSSTGTPLKGSVYGVYGFMALASRMAKPTYVLQIFVAGEKGRSRSAVQNLKKICEKELPGQYKIEVVDVSKKPRAAIENNLTALPAVFRTLPAPVRKFVGNWANEDHELVGFDLITQDKPKPAKRSSKR
jgi:circadian clock protein KaiB